MKKRLGRCLLSLAGCLLVVSACFLCYPAPSKAEELETSVSTWQILDSTSSAGTEPTALGVTERTYLTVRAAIAAAASGDEEISVFRITRSSRTKANAIRIRALGITDGGTATYDVFSGTLADSSDCELMYLGTLAFTIGTQASTIATYELGDTLVVTTGDATVSWTSTSSATNRIAEATIDLQGADLLILVPTTVTADCKLLGKFY
jgi:hypothetical protein